MDPNQQEQQNKTKKNRIKILVTIIVILVIVAIPLIYYRNDIIPNNVTIQTKMLEENTFYLAKKDNAPVLFYRYPDIFVEHKKPPASLGHVVHYEKMYDLKKGPKEYIDFKELQDPKKLFTFEGHPGIENYILSEDKRYLLISFLGGKTDSTNYIYQIDLQSLKSQKIWEHEIRSGEPPYNGGIAYVTHFIPDQYIAFAIVKSDPPPAALPVGVIIKNIQSGQEKVVGVVGDVQINTTAGTISFKKLEKTQVPCEKDDPACFATDTYKFAFQPGGETITEELPQ